MIGRIEIDRGRCNGCGICADACGEDAIEIVGGKAEIKDGRCDGMGDCLPLCPTGAISISATKTDAATFSADRNGTGPERPGKWPIQLKLVNSDTMRFNGSDILFATDCTAFVSQTFHRRFVGDRTVLIGCPKFDAGDYMERLAQIFIRNDVRSVLLVRMEVPCCTVMEKIVKGALAKSQKRIPYKVVVLTVDGAVVG